jgi:transposase
LIENGKLWRWYHDSLSGFLDEDTVRKRHQHDIKIRKNGIEKQIRIPILKVENFGENMAIDEKQIGEEMHTIITNRDTNKIAVLACSIKSFELVKLLPAFHGKGFEVKSITRDLSPSYDWFCRQAFLNTRHIADKFHIIKHLMDSFQDVRVRYRQELLTDKRIKHKAHNAKELERKKQCKINKENYLPKKFIYQEKKTANGETLLELLARSRYLLYKYPSDWTDNQKERAEILFKIYPEIETSYYLACEFRNWYKKGNVGKDRTDLLQELQNWYKKVENSEVVEMENFKFLVERNQGIILNYFIKGETNAIAECINSKIQRFIASNQGTRDREFFYFRLANFFA